jgi:hypothetical protein
MYPLFSFVNFQNRKNAFISGTGLWRWQLTDYQVNTNHFVLNDLLNKIVQYLTIQSDNRFFRVKAKDTYDQNENVILEAELYNENYELINSPDVEIVIMNEEGQEYPYVFLKNNDKYSLDAGVFPGGKYTYYATVESSGKTFTDQGEFVIESVNIEFVNTVADHQLLYRISGIKDANLVYPDSLSKLPEYLEQRDDIYTVTYYDKDFIPLINILWLLISIIFLLALEWFIRKWLGVY